MPSIPPFVPSTSLPTLTNARALPSTELLQASLERIATALGAGEDEHVWVPRSGDKDNDEGCRGSSQVAAEDEDDAFEISHLRNWLTRLVALLSSSSDPQHLDLIDEAAALLSICSGKSASGSSNKVFHIPLPPSSGSGSSHLSVRLRDLAFTRDATGARTWGSAPLLAREVLNDARWRRRWIDSDASGAQGPRRVLELGAGTGLVSLALAKHTAFSSVHRGEAQAEVTTTDFHPDVLSNLTHNVSLLDHTAKAAGSGEPVEAGSVVRVRKLDWRSAVPTEERGCNTPRKGQGTSGELQSAAETLHDVDADGQTRMGGVEDLGKEERFDLILAADCVYDPWHPLWLSHVVERHLSCSNADARFLLMQVRRPTHEREERELERVFPAANHGEREEGNLILLTVRDFKGTDNFGAPRLRLGRTAAGEGRERFEAPARGTEEERVFRLYEIGRRREGKRLEE